MWPQFEVRKRECADQRQVLFDGEDPVTLFWEEDDLKLTFEGK